MREPRTQMRIKHIHEANTQPTFESPFTMTAPAATRRTIAKISGAEAFNSRFVMAI